MADVAVVGGGLAGVTAALELSGRGATVVMVERARVLGGLCRSVADPVAGRVDTGQHVYLGCCTELERLLEQVGAEPAWRQTRLELVVASPNTGISRRLRASALPPPLHLATMLLRWPGLRTRQLVGTWTVAAALRSLSPQDEVLLDVVPALAWLQGLGQDAVAIRRLWEPFLVSACNVPLDSCSARVAAFVIREGLLQGSAEGALRIPKTDLTLWLDPGCRRALAAAKVELHLGWRATTVQPGAARRYRLLNNRGDEVEADQLVLSASAHASLGVLRPLGVADPILEAAASLPQSPIVNLHLFTDRPFLPGPVVAVPGSPLQWVFDRSQLGERDLDLEGEPIFHSAISLSAADEAVSRPEREVVERLWPLCQELFPAARRARLRHSRVTRERAATFAAGPGSAGSRPGPRTTLEGVWLAGAWTDTGWPATMEGAVRSGRRAALQAALA